MSNRNMPSDNLDLEALLRSISEEDLKLLDPPDEVWEGIERAVKPERYATATVVPITSRRRRVRGLMLSGAAALVAMVILVIGIVALRDDPGDVLATATLLYDPENFDSLGLDTAAEVDLVAKEGKLTIHIVKSDLPSPGESADLEVWLIRPDDEGNVADLISVGLVDPANPGTLDIPPGHDPTVYHIVDISIEPRDGDPGHSGRSILRGPLVGH